MDYFAGLDISMDETHVCVLDREGVVVRESKAASTAEAIAAELAKAPTCRRIVFETGRMAPILFHGLNQLGLPVVCVESRQAYQALKSFATHKTDRNDARGLAHLARTGFFKPVHVKSLSAHAIRSLIGTPKKLVGQRVTLENQIRGLTVVFGVRLPRALTAEIHLIITGDWSLPVREAESAQALIDAGCDVIACHVDSPKVVIETAESRGAKTLGHNADQSSLAPKGFITGAQMKWSTVYDAYAKLIAKGEKLPNLDEGGYDKDLVLSTSFGAGANDATRKAVQAAIDDMKADKPIFVGGVKDNKGNVLSAKTLDLYDGSLWGTNYLIEGVIGSIT
jgi:hypothetical protein